MVHPAKFQTEVSLNQFIDSFKCRLLIDTPVHSVLGFTVDSNAIMGGSLVFNSEHRIKFTAGIEHHRTTWLSPRGKYPAANHSAVSSSGAIHHCQRICTRSVYAPSSESFLLPR